MLPRNGCCRLPTRPTIRVPSSSQSVRGRSRATKDLQASSSPREFHIDPRRAAKWHRPSWSIVDRRRTRPGLVDPDIEQRVGSWTTRTDKNTLRLKRIAHLSIIFGGLCNRGGRRSEPAVQMKAKFRTVVTSCHPPRLGRTRTPPIVVDRHRRRRPIGPTIHHPRQNLVTNPVVLVGGSPTYCCCCFLCGLRMVRHRNGVC